MVARALARGRGMVAGAPARGRGMKVRAALPADRQALLALRCALWPQCQLPQHEDELSRRAQSGARHETLLVENEDGRPCGFVELTREPPEPGRPGRVILLGVYVSPPVRRRGAARLLLAAAERWAHGRGAAHLVCDLDAQDAVAHEALAWLGFGEAEQRLRVYRRVNVPLEVVRAPAAAAAAPTALAARAAPAGRAGAGPLLVLLNVLLFAAALASFAHTDIFARDTVRGVVLPLLDVVFVLYFLAVGLAWRYRRRADSSTRAERLFRGE